MIIYMCVSARAFEGRVFVCVRAYMRGGGVIEYVNNQFT